MGLARIVGVSAHRGPRWAAATATAALAVLGLPAGAFADVSVPAGSGHGDVAAAGGQVAYTTGSGRLQLELGPFAAATTVPVAAARDIRGVDLGTDAGGALVLVYSRCERRCDLFAYSPATRKERKLTSLSRSACTERNPRMVKGAVAFVREERRSKHKSTRCTGGIYLKRPGHKLQRVSSTQASSLDYDGRVLAYTRRHSGVGGEGEITRTQICVLRPGGKVRVLASATDEVGRGGDSGTFLGEAVLDGGQVYWTRSSGEDSPYSDDSGTDIEDILRAPATGGRAQVLDRAGRLWVHSDPTGQDQSLSGLAVDGPRLFYAYGTTTELIGQVAGTPVFR